MNARKRILLCHRDSWASFQNLEIRAVGARIFYFGDESANRSDSFTHL